MAENLELRKLELEEKRFEFEKTMKGTEISLEKRKITLERMKMRQDKSHGVSPLATASLSAFALLLGAGIGSAIQGYSNLKIERQRFEANLILKAIATNNDEKASIKNLNFLVKAGFLSDDTNQIANLMKTPNKAPVLPTFPSNYLLDQVETDGLKAQKRVLELLSKEATLSEAREELSNYYSNVPRKLKYKHSPKAKKSLP